MQELDYDEWLKKDLWTLSEFVLLACRFDPIVPEAEIQVMFEPGNAEWAADYYKCCRDLNDLATRSVSNGTLVVDDYSPTLRQAAQPIVFIRWAKAKGVTLPQELSSKQIRRQERKLETQEKYKAWGKEATRLQEQHPEWNLERIAREIAKMDIAEGAARSHIRRNWIK